MGSSTVERLDPRVLEAGGSTPSPCNPGAKCQRLHTEPNELRGEGSSPSAPIRPDSSDGKRALDEPQLSGGREAPKGKAHHGSGDNQGGVRPPGEGSGSGCREVPGSSPGRATKLFIVGRQDLPAGLRVAQMFHALTSFIFGKPKETGEWFAKSNNLVLLEVPDKGALEDLLARLISKGIPVASFCEPDLGDELTAVAVGPEGRRALSTLPLAFKVDTAE
jgi:hypothetical protein